MLTAAQIDALRDKVLHRQRPIEGPTVPLTFSGGPLDGLTVEVDIYSAHCECIGWVQRTADDAVQCLYRCVDASNTRVFDRYVGNQQVGGRGYGVER